MHVRSGRVPLTDLGGVPSNCVTVGRSLFDPVSTGFPPSIVM